MLPFQSKWNCSPGVYGQNVFQASMFTSWLCNQLSVHSGGFILLLKCTSYCFVQATSDALPPPTGLNWCSPSPSLACSLVKIWHWNQIWDLAKAAGTLMGGLPRCTPLKWEQKSKIKRKWQQQQCVRCAENATGWASLAEKQKPVTVPQTLVTFSHYWVIIIIIITGRSHHVLIQKETDQWEKMQSAKSYLLDRSDLLSHNKRHYTGNRPTALRCGVERGGEDDKWMGSSEGIPSEVCSWWALVRSPDMQYLFRGLYKQFSWAPGPNPFHFNQASVFVTGSVCVIVEWGHMFASWPHGRLFPLFTVMRNKEQVGKKNVYLLSCL